MLGKKNSDSKQCLFFDLNINVWYIYNYSNKSLGSFMSDSSCIISGSNPHERGQNMLKVRASMISPQFSQL